MDMDFYKKNALFQNISEQDIRDALMCLHAYKRSYQKNEIIYHAGSSTGFIGLILQGSVIVERNDAWGNRMILTAFSKGDFFAEAYAMNPQSVIPVDIIAREASTVIFLGIGIIASRSCAVPHALHQITVNLLKISLQKNILLSNRSFLLASKTMREKILGYLTHVSLQEHSSEFDIPFNRQQLADFLNLDRTALSKELSKMQADGLIAFRKNHFRLLTPKS